MNAKPRTHRNVTLKLPDEFIELCRRDGVTPEVVLCGFTADLCELWNNSSAPRPNSYCNNGPEERRKACEY
jgi:hypothetical protein